MLRLDETIMVAVRTHHDRLGAGIPNKNGSNVNDAVVKAKALHGCLNQYMQGCPHYSALSAM